MKFHIDVLVNLPFERLSLETFNGVVSQNKELFRECRYCEIVVEKMRRRISDTIDEEITAAHEILANKI